MFKTQSNVINESMIAQTMNNVFGDNESEKIQEMVKDIYSGKFDIVMPIVKKGYGTLDTVCKTISLCEPKNDILVCSDKMLNSPEFIEILRRKKNICIFDDSVRFGRKLIGICKKINQICEKENFVVSIHIRVIAKYYLFDESSLGVESFNQIKVCDETSDLKKCAEKVLSMLYMCMLPCVIGASKTFPKVIEQKDIHQHCRRLLLNETKNDTDIKLLNDLNISLWERFLNETELNKLFAPKLASFISQANIELYVYKLGENHYTQIVSRALLTQISVDDLNYILSNFWRLFTDNHKDYSFSTIINAKPELKFEWLNYIISNLVAYEIMGVSYYQFDTNYLFEHYGETATYLIQSIESNMRKDYNVVKKEIELLFINKEGDFISEDSINTELEPFYKSLLDKLFKDVSNEYVTLRSYYYLQSNMEKILNEEALKLNLPLIDAFEMPMHTLKKYLIPYYGGEEAVRKELIHHQIAGRISVFSRYVDMDGIQYVQKFAKAGESADDALTLQNKEALATSIEQSILSLQMFCDNLVSHLKKIYGKLKDEYRFLTKMLKTQAELFSVSTHIHSYHQSNGNDVCVMTVHEKISALQSVWYHIDDKYKEAFINIEPIMIDKLFELFVSQNKTVIFYDNDTQNPITGIEDFAVRLTDNWTLIFRVYSEVIDSNNEMSRKILTLAIPKTVSRLFAYVVENYNVQKHKEFNTYIDNLIFGYDA